MRREPTSLAWPSAYVDEGTRMDEHPGIVFRGGPTGPRAALAGGPDVWERMTTLKGGMAQRRR